MELGMITGPATSTISRRGASRRRRAAVGWCLVALLVGACQAEETDRRPDTQAMGVNANARGNGVLVKVRNALIVSRASGRGFLSATLTSSKPDALVAVGGTATLPGGTPGAPLQATLPEPVEISSRRAVVLTDGAPITISSPDLRAGTSAKVTLRFRRAGQVSLLVPVYRDQQEFQTVGPSPTAAADG